MGDRRIFIPQATDTALFKTVLYTGTGNALTVSGVGFEPDLIWIKKRVGSLSVNVLFDRLRSDFDPYLISDGTGAEVSRTDMVTGTNSDGFTLGTDATTAVNANTHTYVAWCWKANGSASSNTDGSITTQVSANVDSGFSIITYTGNGTSGATVGHGLNSAPDMIIVRPRNNTTESSWEVYHSTTSTSDTSILRLNMLAGKTTVGTAGMDYSEIDSDTVTLKTSLRTNSNNVNYIMYCFHSVSGVQKFGGYSGTGTTNAITGVGFQPSFLMVKRTDTDGNWQVWDSLRNPSADNNNNNVLYWNRNYAESDAGTGVYVSFDSDGFTFYGASGNNNSSTGTYIYWAIA